jgi:outer membrane murein-binding lipoprotein Lpp
MNAKIDKLGNAIMDLTHRVDRLERRRHRDESTAIGEANRSGATHPEQLRAEIREWSKSVHERIAVAREAAARWQRLADSHRR